MVKVTRRTFAMSDVETIGASKTAERPAFGVAYPAAGVRMSGMRELDR